MGASIQSHVQLKIGIDRQLSYLIQWFRRTSAFQVKIFDGRTVHKEDIRDCDALFVRTTVKVDAALLEGTAVRFIGTASSGVDHIDVDYLKAMGILLFDAKGMNALTVAEYVLYVILLDSIERQLPVENRSIGIIGFGNIGRIVAFLAAHFQMKVVVNDPPLWESGYHFPEYVQLTTLEELIRQVDVLTLHIPLTFSGRYPTYRLFTKKRLETLRPTALVINTSRGDVVDEEAILEICRSGGRQRFAIDTWQNEPQIRTELCRSVWFATPHIAGYSQQAQWRIQFRLLQYFDAFFFPCREIVQSASSDYPYENGSVLRLTGQKTPNSTNEVFALLDHFRPLLHLAQQFKSGCGKKHYSEIFDLLRTRALEMSELLIPEVHQFFPALSVRP